MDWRRPTFSEAWEIALVVLVLGVGVVLIAGLPAGRSASERAWRQEWSCVAEGDEPGCIQRAERPLQEGRAIGRLPVSEP